MAVQMVSTLNPLIKLSAKKIIMALITSRNKPKVKMVIGMVKITNKGFTKVFNNPNTTATIIAVT